MRVRVRARFINHPSGVTDMVNTDKIGAYILLFIGGLFVGAGSMLIGDAYTTMHQIEAQGLLGQAVYEQQYETALSKFRWSIPLLILGFAGLVIGGFSYLVGELKGMVDQ